MTAIAAAIFCLAASYVITGVNTWINSDKNIILDDGWSVIYNGESYNDVNLNNFRLPKTMGKVTKLFYIRQYLKTLSMTRLL